MVDLRVKYMSAKFSTTEHTVGETNAILWVLLIRLLFQNILQIFQNITVDGLTLGLNSWSAPLNSIEVDAYDSFFRMAHRPLRTFFHLWINHSCHLTYCWRMLNVSVAHFPSLVQYFILVLCSSQSQLHRQQITRDNKSTIFTATKNAQYCHSPHCLMNITCNPYFSHICALPSTGARQKYPWNVAIPPRKVFEFALFHFIVTIEWFFCVNLIWICHYCIFFLFLSFHLIHFYPFTSLHHVA